MKQKNTLVKPQTAIQKTIDTENRVKKNTKNQWPNLVLLR